MASHLHTGGIRRILTVLVVILCWTSLISCANASEVSLTVRQVNDVRRLYTQPYACVMLHSMGGSRQYPWDQELFEYLACFDTIWVGNSLELPSEWVDYLHTHDGKRRNIIFYENFPSVGFIRGKDNPLTPELWQIGFLDDHLTHHYSINPLVPPHYDDYSPGQLSPGKPFRHYFINYDERRIGVPIGQFVRALQAENVNVYGSVQAADPIYLKPVMQNLGKRGAASGPFTSGRPAKKCGYRRGLCPNAERPRSIVHVPINEFTTDTQLRGFARGVRKVLDCLGA